MAHAITNQTKSAAATITDQVKSAAATITDAVKGLVGFITTDSPDFVLVGENSDEVLIWFELGALTNQAKS